MLLINNDNLWTTGATVWRQLAGASCSHGRPVGTRRARDATVLDGCRWMHGWRWRYWSLSRWWWWWWWGPWTPHPRLRPADGGRLRPAAGTSWTTCCGPRSTSWRNSAWLQTTWWGTSGAWGRRSRASSPLPPYPPGRRPQRRLTSGSPQTEIYSCVTLSVTEPCPAMMARLPGINFYSTGTNYHVVAKKKLNTIHTT